MQLLLVVKFTISISLQTVFQVQPSARTAVKKTLVVARGRGAGCVTGTSQWKPKRTFRTRL